MVSFNVVLQLKPSDHLGIGYTQQHAVPVSRVVVLLLDHWLLQLLKVAFLVQQEGNRLLGSLHNPLGVVLLLVQRELVLAIQHGFLGITVVPDRDHAVNFDEVGALDLNLAFELFLDDLFYFLEPLQGKIKQLALVLLVLEFDEFLIVEGFDFLAEELVENFKETHLVVVLGFAFLDDLKEVFKHHLRVLLRRFSNSIVSRA